MKRQTVVPMLVGMNLLLLVVLLFSNGIIAQNDPDILQGRALELLDDTGQIKAHINVEDDGQVVLCLRDETGAIRVKLGADQHGSGFVLMDERTESAIQMIARQKGTQNDAVTTSISLRGSNGQAHVILP